ncbi:MAG TPA: gliding motility lipoprotein GldB [Flavobacterium sp.]|jgi:gliding motility-associated lipoprotein GldB
MKNSFILFFLFIVFTACNKKSKIEKAVEDIPLNLEVVRFDKIFYETPPENLQKVKQQFPYFFPGNDDSVWINKMQDPLWRELYTEVQKKFPNLQNETEQIEDVVKHIKYYFPRTPNPKVITLISEMDYNTKAIYADTLILVSLEMYLGKDHKFYEFPKYLKENFEPRQIGPDIASSFASGVIPPPTDNTLLGLMIYHGKELYLKDMLLPNHTDAEKIGYTPDQITWAGENENYIWRYLVEEKLLYDANSKLPNRFINPAPFSKFYLEIDNESPGRIGQWVGWQIVRSFMENNEIPLHDMLKLEARQLFEQSKYKPKKPE